MEIGYVIAAVLEAAQENRARPRFHRVRSGRTRPPMMPDRRSGERARTASAGDGTESGARRRSGSPKALDRPGRSPCSTSTPDMMAVVVPRVRLGERLTPMRFRD